MDSRVLRDNKFPHQNTKIPHHPSNLNICLNIFLNIFLSPITKYKCDYEIFLSKFDSDGVQGAQGPQISPPEHKKIPIIRQI